MYRKYIEDLKIWINKANRKPLILWGARKIGKTYLLKELFAEKFFNKKYIYIDCFKEEQFVNYCYKHTNVKDILNYLSLHKNIVIDKNVLLIFDEIQECPLLISYLKYFYQDYPEIPIIVTGSMIKNKINRENKKRGSKSFSKFLFPIGKINQLTIYPLNFEEYLINRNKSFYDFLVDSYNKKEALTPKYHQEALKYFHEFLFLGGMPEAIDTFLKNENYQDARLILKDIYNNFLLDMELYQVSKESIIRSKKIFEDIYLELNKTSKNFKPSLIEKGVKNRDLIEPINWLTKAFLIQKSLQEKEKIVIPLIESNESNYRLYLLDVGLFSYQSNINDSNFIINDEKNTLPEIFYENYVANELTIAGFKLFYWNGKNNSEFEFIIENNSSIIPIIVKKSRGTLNSLEKFKNHNKYIGAIKISKNNFKYDIKTKILTVPYYYTFLILKDLKSKRFGEIV